MKRASWTLSLTLALPLLAAAGCKDSNQNYIGFDAAPDASASDAKGDGGSSDAPAGEANRNDVLNDVLATDTPPAPDAVSDASIDGDASADASPDGASDAASEDAESGQ
jgi:hypothetical protein